MPPFSLPMREELPEVPLYTGHLEGRLEEDLRTVGRNKLASVLFPVARPSKLPCPAWGIPASECHTGSVAGRNPRSVCHESNCYAKKGRYLFENVQAKLRQSFRFLFDPLHVPAAIHMIDWESEDYFRWFHSGDLQGVHHLKNIITIANHLRHIVFWLPTRERETVLACKDEIPDNLRIRASAMTVGGAPPTWWNMTSTVVESREPGDNVCPSWEQSGKCDDCRACTDPEVENVIYRKT